MHFLFLLAKRLSSCLFFATLLLSLFCFGLPHHLVAGNVILISKQFLQRGNGFSPQSLDASKGQLCPQYFRPSSKHNTLAFLRFFHLSSQQKGFSSFSQRCRHNSNSVVSRSLQLSPSFHMHIHSQSIDQVHMLDAR